MKKLIALISLTFLTACVTRGRLQREIDLAIGAERDRIRTEEIQPALESIETCKGEAAKLRNKYRDILKFHNKWAKDLDDEALLNK